MSFIPTKLGTALTASDAAAGDQYGVATALSADGLTLVVSAPAWESAGTDRGSVYTYTWNGSAWVDPGFGILSAADAADSDLFGISVSLSADGLILIVGAPYAEAGAPASIGQVYTYARASRSTNAWTASSTPWINGPTPAADDSFGYSVAISGDGLLLAVGAIGRTATYSDQGTVYVYTRSGTSPNYTWSLRDTLVASDKSATDYFGISSALNSNGTILVTGASSWEGTYSNEGGVYTFDWNATSSTWQQRATVLTGGFFAQAEANFGYTCTLNGSGNTLLVSSLNYDRTYSDEGAAFLFDWDSASSTWVLRNSDILPADVPLAGAGLRGMDMTEGGTFAVIGSSAAAVGGSVQMWQLEQGAYPGGWNAAPEISSITATGGGGHVRTMTGEMELPAIETSGLGAFAIYGNGPITLPLITGSGSATTSILGTTGASEIPAITAAGTGGTHGGSITLPLVTGTGVGYIGSMATGDIQLPRITSSGVAFITSFSTGAIILPKVTVSATGLTGVLAAGDIILNKVRASGTGYFGTTGIGAIILPPIVMGSGAAVQTTYMSGRVGLRKLQVSGIVL